MQSALRTVAALVFVALSVASACGGTSSGGTAAKENLPDGSECQHDSECSSGVCSASPCCTSACIATCGAPAACCSSGEGCVSDDACCAGLVCCGGIPLTQCLDPASTVAGPFAPGEWCAHDCDCASHACKNGVCE